MTETTIEQGGTAVKPHVVLAREWLANDKPINSDELYEMLDGLCNDVERLQGALREIAYFGSSIPLGMTEVQFAAASRLAMRRIAVIALAGQEPS